MPWEDLHEEVTSLFADHHDDLHVAVFGEMGMHLDKDSPGERWLDQRARGLWSPPAETKLALKRMERARSKRRYKLNRAQENARARKYYALHRTRLRAQALDRYHQTKVLTGRRPLPKKLTDDEVLCIRAIWDTDPEATTRALAEHFGVSHVQINHIVNRRLWAHL